MHKAFITVLSNLGEVNLNRRAIKILKSKRDALDQKFTGVLFSNSFQKANLNEVM